MSAAGRTHVPSDQRLVHPARRRPPGRYGKRAYLSCTKFVTDATFTDALLRQRDETRDLVGRRQSAHQERFGEAMSDDNVWLKGRNEELAALTGILHAIDSVRRDDGTIVPLRGAGAPQQRVDDRTGHDEESAS
ncbi:hypothetical protein ABZ734_32230 [Streptomyces sp. NPDC006660]|uniref:hypothetical protein n=1 Tax=Streptomyces sp. NPDC006660 TaxID=3156901 RepID=UPI0033C175DD